MDFSGYESPVHKFSGGIYGVGPKSEIFRLNKEPQTRKRNWSLSNIFHQPLHTLVPTQITVEVTDMSFVTLISGEKYNQIKKLLEFKGPQKKRLNKLISKNRKEKSYTKEHLAYQHGMSSMKKRIEKLELKTQLNFIS